MTPTPGSDEADIDIKSEEKDSPKSTEQVSKTSSKAAAKRRTKTGCLTCRKRRIKCGEEKPYCKNCIKSKRECAGYVQPLVYKQQQGLSVHDPGSRSSLSDGEFQFNEGFGLGNHASASQFGPFNPFLSLQGHVGQEPRPRNVALHTQSFQYPPPEPSHTYAALPSAYSLETLRRHSFQDHNTHLLGFGASAPIYTTGHESTWPSRPVPSPLSTQPTVTYDTFGVPTTMMTSPGAYSESYAGVSSNHYPFDATSLHEPPTRRYSVHGFVQAAPLDPNIPTLGIPDGFSANVEDPDDPYDVDMEDEPEHVFLENDILQSSAEARSRSGPKTRPVDQHARLRQRGVVKTLNQSSVLSPLLDERNERVFKHFVDVLAPCMSIFERPALDPWASPPRTLWSYVLPSAAMSNPALAHAILAISGLHIAKLQQSAESLALKHVTYAARRVGRLLSLPQRRHDVTTLATVLVLGFYEVLGADHSRWNLHLAGATKLVTEHDLAGLTYRARRSRSRAKQILTSYSAQGLPIEASQLGIAPSLLDGVAWNLDQKIVSDLTGLSIDYDNIRSHTTNENEFFQPMTEPEVATYRTKMDLWWWFCKQDMFQSLVSGERLLMPYHLRISCPPRGQLGIPEAHYATFDHLVLLLSRLSDFGGKDRHRKQRAIDARGTPWRPPSWLFPTQAAPEGSAPLSKATPNAPLQQSHNSRTASGPTADDQGHLQHQRAPSANEGRVRQSRAGPSGGMAPTQPPMFGMMPPPPIPPKMHSSFHAMDRSLRSGGTANLPEAVKHSPPGMMNLEDERKAALAEHEAITKAFDLFHALLGPGWQPVPHEGSQPSSPFGPRLRYSSPEIACIWALYDMGQILLKRLHPDMPPAAMVAAGVTAHLTKDHAQKIGQIWAGLFTSIPEGNPGEPLSPRFAGALMEVTFPILFAGVQYSDMSQRGWLISKLHDVAQMTGWATSAAIAAACETSWEKMGQAGKGPPYIRSLDRNNKDVRVNGSLRRLAPQLASAMTELESEHESQFVSHDRSQISKSGPSRVHWAMGLLSVEEDVRKMNIGKE